jgi:hypothetical protein
MEFLIGLNPQNYPIHMSGGMTCIKKLAEILSDKKHKVYVLNKQYNIGNTILINESEINKLDKDKLVVIYPEIVSGNPYGIKNVARWILYHSKFDVEVTWSHKDSYFYFSEFFESFRKEDKMIMDTYEFNLDKLHDMNLEREGYCHVARPKTPLDYELSEKYNSEDLFKGHMTFGIEWLIDKFNQKKYFITYDDATYYSVMASLCGCISIILYNNEKKYNLKDKIPTHKYGISYGLEEIDESILTRNLLRPHLEKIEQDSLKSVDNFISFWNKKLKK